jgi:predicted nicotinamide N-methyase
MTIQVHFWNKKMHEVHDVDNVRETLLETSAEVDIILTSDIVGVQDMAEELCALKRAVDSIAAECVCQCKICVCISACIVSTFLLQL